MIPCTDDRPRDDRSSTAATRGLWAVLLSVVLAGAGSWPAGAQDKPLVIKITEGTEQAQPIAIVPFGWADPATRPPVRMAEVVADDLARTGRFLAVPFADLPSKPSDAADVNFGDFRILGTSNLVIGRLETKADGRYNVQFRLYDVFRGAQITGYELDAAPDELRRIAHQISDIIYEQLTGERGAFDTSIAYVTERRGPQGARFYALHVADSDGHKAHPVLETREPVLSPAWSPDGRQLAYVSYQDGRIRIYVQNLASGARSQIAAYPGINGAPAWSPDGTRLAMTLSKDGNPEIYILDLRSQRLLRLTANPAIDTEPAWAPDGETLVFTSDRGGGPQIYRMAATGGRAERLTFEGKYNARATFSPDGSKIAFVHAQKGAFRIATLDLETSNLQILTRSTLDESPSFAPNGSMILYSTVDGDRATLAAVSIDGNMRQQLAAREGHVREPSWSPFRRR